MRVGLIILCRRKKFRHQYILDVEFISQQLLPSQPDPRLVDWLRKGEKFLLEYRSLGGKKIPFVYVPRTFLAPRLLLWVGT